MVGLASKKTVLERSRKACRLMAMIAAVVMTVTTDCIASLCRTVRVRVSKVIYTLQELNVAEKGLHALWGCKRISCKRLHCVHTIIISTYNVTVVQITPMNSGIIAIALLHVIT